MVKKNSPPRFRPEASTSLSPTSLAWDSPSVGANNRRTRSSPQLTLPQAVANSMSSSTSAAAHKRACSPFHLTSPQILGRFTMYVIRSKPKSRPASRASSSLSRASSPLSPGKRKTTTSRTSSRANSRRQSPAAAATVRSPKSNKSAKSPQRRSARIRSRSRTR